jgi:hypothetical protein
MGDGLGARCYGQSESNSAFAHAAGLAKNARCHSQRLLAVARGPWAVAQAHGLIP